MVLKLPVWQCSVQLGKRADYLLPVAVANSLPHSWISFLSLFHVLSPTCLLPGDCIPYKPPCTQVFLSSWWSMSGKFFYQRVFSFTHSVLFYLHGSSVLGHTHISTLYHNATWAGTVGRFTAGCHSYTRMGSSLIHGYKDHQTQAAYIPSLPSPQLDDKTPGPLLHHFTQENERA